MITEELSSPGARLLSDEAFTAMVRCHLRRMQGGTSAAITCAMNNHSQPRASVETTGNPLADSSL
jgi:hypothetical protein